MKTICLLVAAALASPATAETVTGRAEVVDGDTVRVGQRTIRLVGIDAPELKQTCELNGETWNCGEESARQLRDLIADDDLFCTGFEIDQHGRLLAQCNNRLGNVNQLMVQQGWAMAFQLYSDDYVADEIRAKAGRRGLWASSFTLPWDFRQQAERDAPRTRPTSRNQVAPASNARSPGCRIKGNRSRRGEWIYHLPGMPYYEETRAEEMFCSEAEARAAGYRRSKAG